MDNQENQHIEVKNHPHGLVVEIPLQKGVRILIALHSIIDLMLSSNVAFAQPGLHSGNSSQFYVPNTCQSRGDWKSSKVEWLDLSFGVQEVGT